MSKEFEVEKKFSLDGVDLEKLTTNAELVTQKSFTDLYFDDESYSLTKQDVWLRKRDGKFELKLPLNDGFGALTRKLDQYEEVTDEKKIKEALGITENGSLEDCLKNSGINSFCSITTNRTKYKKGDFVIDIDQMDFGYGVGEIELMVSSKEDMDNAMEKILNFAIENGITLKSVPGKVAEFIRRNRPEHHQKLVESGVY